MAKQGKASDSLGDVSRQHLTNVNNKSPQRSISPNFYNPNHSKIIKDTSIHSIVKTNSSSLLKKKSLKRIKTISPIIGKSPSSSIIIKNQKIGSLLNKKASIKHIENGFPGISQNHITSNRSFTPISKLEISIDLDKGDSSFEKSKPKIITFEKMIEKYEMYKRVFDEIILKDKPFAVVLRKIKEVYEEFYDLSMKEHTDKLKDKIKSLHDDIEKKCEEIIGLDKRVRKLSTENYDLAKSLERSEEICTRVQERLNKISKFDISEVPKNEETWKSLLIENEAYAISFKNLESKLKLSKENERKMQKLISELKKSGFPIEEFYKKNVLKETYEPKMASAVRSETSESDYLISNRELTNNKPEKIPNLDLDKVSHETISSRSQTSSDYY